MTIALALMAATLVRGQGIDAFEVASVRISAVAEGKPSWTDAGEATFTATNIPLKTLIQMAYKVDEKQISGENLCGHEQYDVAAKPQGGMLTAERLEPMLASLLADRFGLVTHREVQTVSGYALIMGKGGLLHASEASGAGRAAVLRGRVIGRAAEMGVLASMLGQVLRVPVVDRTGLDGRYDLDLRFAAEDSLDISLPSLFTAIQEQLGLKLEAQKLPLEMLVIDRCQRDPTAN